MAEDAGNRGPVLDPVERASEAIFGVLMAMTFTGSLSVATTGRDEIRTMLIAAVGCNVAWGLTDAVMYLVGTVTESQRGRRLLQRLRRTDDTAEARRLIVDELPERLAGRVSVQALDAIRESLATVPIERTVLTRRDYRAALGVFGLVVLATFPVVLPFAVFRHVPLAMRVSNGLAVATLYAYGHVLGKYSGGRPWRYGLAIAATGMALVAIIITLGG